jgi:tRNA pseudouridine55 synthase
MTVTINNNALAALSEGILIVDKAKGSSSFKLVYILRKILGVKKIGHAGTLDPFATGVMVMLIGRNFTRLSDQFLSCDKEYVAEVFLGISTDTYDCEGTVTAQSPHIPSEIEVMDALAHFQGDVDQIPPMYSAKKQKGKKLYELARQGIEVERAPVRVNIQAEVLSYRYPYLQLRVQCSKGTYIRSLGHDLGAMLGCGAHLTNLRRTRSGTFTLADSIAEEDLVNQAPLPLLAII